MTDFDTGDFPATASSDDRTWAIIVHLSALAGLIVPLGSILGPFIVWIIKKPESEHVNRHGKAALNFQISMLIYLIPIIILIFVVIGIFLVIAYMLFCFIMIIVATVRAADDKDPGYLFAIPFLK